MSYYELCGGICHHTLPAFYTKGIKLAIGNDNDNKNNNYINIVAIRIVVHSHIIDL